MVSEPGGRTSAMDWGTAGSERTPDEVGAVVQGEQTRGQLAGAHHGSEDDLAAVVDAAGRDRDSGEGKGGCSCGLLGGGHDADASGSSQKAGGPKHHSWERRGRRPRGRRDEEAKVDAKVGAERCLFGSRASSL